MTPVNVGLCLVCVTMVSLGQVLLRLVAINARDVVPTYSIAFVGSTWLAVAVYGGAMLMWLYILGRVPLSVAFPFFGLCFMLVPLLSHWIVGDPVSASTWVGAGVILVGISISTVSGQSH